MQTSERNAVALGRRRLPVERCSVAFLPRCGAEGGCESAAETRTALS